MTISLMTIRNCVYDNSTYSKSDDSDDEYMTGDRQTVHTEREEKI